MNVGRSNCNKNFIKEVKKKKAGVPKVHHMYLDGVILKLCSLSKIASGTGSEFYYYFFQKLFQMQMKKSCQQHNTHTYVND